VLQACCRPWQTFIWSDFDRYWDIENDKGKMEFVSKQIMVINNCIKKNIYPNRF
jgi:hypothetical protein